MFGEMTALFNRCFLKLGVLTKPTDIKQTSIKSNLIGFEYKQKISVWNLFFREFCNNTSLHAINQVAKPIFRPHEKYVVFLLRISNAYPPNAHSWRGVQISNEKRKRRFNIIIKLFMSRLLWTVLFILGVLGASFTCMKTWARYTQSTTSTIIETTRFSYANVPFPSVTVCDKSRVDWARALELTPEHVPEPFAENKSKLLAVLKRVAYASFGDFDFFDQLRLENDTDFSNLNNLNMTDILLKVMRPCEEMFFEWCWFRDLEYDCCSIFELQRTEYGFCWSFNSDTSEPSRRLSKGWFISGKSHWVDSHGRRRPWRTAQHGLWSGLRFKVIALAEERLPPDGNHTTTGVFVGVADPKGELHNGFIMVAPGQEIRLPVWGEALIATEDVRELKYSARNCLFPEEDVYGLPQGYYLAANCRVACYQNYTLHYCNCSPDFIFFNRDHDGKTFNPCNAEGLMCLSEFNDIFTYEVPPINSEFFPSTKTGINCTCPSDCQSQLYVTELSAPSKGNISSTTEIDVHFRLPECILYKTDVVYQWLDAVVSFGGIAGLFLGASLLSAAEILYFCTIRCIIIWRRAKRQPKTSGGRVYPFRH